MGQLKIFAATIVIIFIIQAVPSVHLHAAGHHLLKHGATYYFRSAVDDVSLTAHKHKFSKDGLIPGIITAEKFERSDNQMWDAVLVKHGVFWLVNHKHGVSEITTLKTDGSPFPPKNFIALEHVGGTEFLMKSTVNDGCIQSHGQHRKVHWVICDKSVGSQRWTAEFLYEEEKVIQ